MEFGGHWCAVGVRRLGQASGGSRPWLSYGAADGGGKLLNQSAASGAPASENQASTLVMADDGCVYAPLPC